jgi:nitroimidazol reductase NimA-like FMN-containing flavoprotein (pyridoxamine 5'-phosphate oxidase superfamily)
MSAREFIESRDEMERILKEETIGYLGLCVDQEPYVVPLNYAYVDGRILFHCALTGKKLDYLRANPRVCFAVGRQFGPVRRHGDGNPCHVDSDSVICYGTGKVIDEPEERMAALTAFNRSFKANAEEISLEAAMKCSVVEICISEMTGRWERPDRKRTYRRFTFPE